MNQSKLATLAPTKKSAIVRARLTEICAAVARGCSYEEIARALAAETGIVISRTALREYVDRELKTMIRCISLRLLHRLGMFDLPNGIREPCYPRSFLN